jgi:chromosomal replication initiator protein
VPQSESVRKLIEAVSARIKPTRFGLFFQGQTCFVPLGNVVIVAVRNLQARDFYEEKFGEDVAEAVAEVFGPNVTVNWVVDEAAVDSQEITNKEAARVDKSKEDTKASEGPEPSGSPDKGTHDPHTPGSKRDLFGDPIQTPKPKGRRSLPDDDDLAKPIASSRSNRRWKLLSEFVVGSSNRLAHASALSVLESPGEEVNPLVLHGPVGTGKTHLLEGIYAGLKRQSDQRPVYITAEEFTTRFVQAVHNNRMGAFRRQFRECTALLLDDLHFLATKKSTQAEFLNTFNELLANNRQVVVTMDCHPRYADELMPELVDRLLGGAIWTLLPPDPDTRLEILRKLAGTGQPPIPDNVLKSLATSLRGNVRELEGAIKSIRHQARVTGRPVDHAVIREALGDLLRHNVRSVTVVDVDTAVCTTLRLASGTLQSKSRMWAVTHPRMLAIYLSRKHTAATYGEIAKHFGAKTHSTALAAEKKVRSWIEKNQSVVIGDRNWQVKELIDRIERELQK